MEIKIVKSIAHFIDIVKMVMKQTMTADTVGAINAMI